MRRLHGTLSGIAVGLTALLARSGWAATVSGHVRDSGSAPVSGATVSAALDVPMLSPLVAWLLAAMLAGTAIFLIRRRGTQHAGRALALLAMLGAVGIGLQASSPAPRLTTIGDNLWTTTTDATGAYTLADLPAGTYGITASKDGYTVGQSTAMDGVALAANQSVSHDFTLYAWAPDSTSHTCQSPHIVANQPISSALSLQLRGAADTRRVASLAAGSERTLDWSSAEYVQYDNYDQKLVVVPVTASAEQRVAEPNRSTSVLYVLDAHDQVQRTMTMSVVIASGATPEVQSMEFRTPDGRMLGAATFVNGAVASVTNPDATLAGYWPCVGQQIKNNWGAMPKWLRRVCGNSCLSCIASLGGNPTSCAICIACLGGYIIVALCNCA
jgi:hypothetical protein